VASYGTHYWMSATFGGVFTASLEIESATMTKEQEQEVTASLSGSYLVVSASAEAAKKDTSKKVDSVKTSKESVVYMGGLTPPDFTPKSLAAWETSVYKTMWLHSGRLGLLTDLLEEGPKREALEQATQAYVRQKYMASLREEALLYTPFAANHANIDDVIGRTMVATKIPTQKDEDDLEKAVLAVRTRFQCKENWVLFGGSCFRAFMEDEATWDQANSNCDGSWSGSYLATVRNREENEFLLKRGLLSGETKNVWLGGRKLAGTRTRRGKGADTWGWKGGNRWVAFGGFRVGGDPPYPNDYDDHQDCLYAWGATGWDDDTCNKRHPYLCRKDM